MKTKLLIAALILSLAANGVLAWRAIYERSKRVEAVVLIGKLKDFGEKQVARAGELITLKDKLAADFKEYKRCSEEIESINSKTISDLQRQLATAKAGRITRTP